ncbi:MAG: hypothetical protein AAF334_03400 [Pseudomonadota bacterium]
MSFSAEMSTGDRRISLVPPPPSNVVSAVEASMPGHCPGSADWRALLDMRPSLDDLAGLGFTRQVDRLRAIAVTGLAETADDERLMALYNLPIPITAAAQFDALFPEARTRRAQRVSYLGGQHAWLPDAVSDFFAQGPGRVERVLWIIRVPEDDGIRGFLPRPGADWFSTDPWSGLGPFELACLPPDAAYLALPDLERLQLPARLRDLDTLDLPRPEPRFLPCAGSLAPVTDPDPETADPPAPPLPLGQVLGPIAQTLAHVRPDMHAVMTLPFAPEGIRDRGFPAPAPAALEALSDFSGSTAEAGLRQVQLLYPYLRSPERSLSSPSGLICAHMAATTVLQGAWTSIAGRPLSRLQQAYPPLDQHQAAALRDDHGIGVLTERNGLLMLDDERLVRPAFGGRSASPSGEVSRFIGWLRRELRRFGERLIFLADPDDPRAGILLDSFFNRLYAQGALAGDAPEDSYSVTQRSAGDGTLLFEIGLAPSVPIDRIRVTLSRDRLDFAPTESGGT